MQREMEVEGGDDGKKGQSDEEGIKEGEERVHRRVERDMGGRECVWGV